MPKTVKLNWEFVFREFEKRGYILTTPTYKNAFHPLYYICRKHPQVVQYIVYNSLQRGCGCWYCGLEKKGQKRRLQLDQVTKATEENGMIYEGLINPDETLHSKSYVRYRCPKHPDVYQQMRYNNIQQKFGCPFCYEEKRKDTKFLSNAHVDTSTYLRGFLRDWKYKSAKASGGACILSGSINYEVHHHYPFLLMLRESCSKLGLPRHKWARNYSKEELAALSEEILRLHEEHGLGICLSGALHDKLHSLYGSRRIITPEEFEEFKRLYHAGELFPAVTKEKH